jgi:hypothetical protein
MMLVLTPRFGWPREIWMPSQVLLIPVTTAATGGGSVSHTSQLASELPLQAQLEDVMGVVSAAARVSGTYVQKDGGWSPLQPASP